jgi:autotransporter-associated beta strand protein
MRTWQYSGAYCLSVLGYLVGRPLFLFVAAFALNAAPQAIAATRVLNGLQAHGCAPSSNWSTPACWQSGVVPVSGDDVVIEGGQCRTNYDLASNVVIRSITLNSCAEAGNALAVTGNVITLAACCGNSGFITNNFNQSGTPGDTFSNDITLGISGTLLVGGDNTRTVFSGVYFDPNGGSAFLIKQGSGTLVLSAANTYTGTTIIWGGTVQVDGSIVGDTPVTGGTLRGVGSVAGQIILSQGMIAPGDPTAPGTLHGSNLEWMGSGALNFRLGATNSSADSDLLVLSGALSLTDFNSGPFKFHFSDGNGPPAIGTTYTLITFASSNSAASDFAFDYSGADGGFIGSFTLTANTLQFTPTAFPVRLQSFTVD